MGGRAAIGRISMRASECDAGNLFDRSIPHLSLSFSLRRLPCITYSAAFSDSSSGASAETEVSIYLPNNIFMMKKMVGHTEKGRAVDQRVFAVQMRLLSISVSLACRLNNSPPSPWAMDCLLVIQATAKFPAGMATTIPPSVSALGCHLRGCV